MLQLLHDVLVRSPRALAECLLDVAQTVERAALDKFPDAKKVAADIAVFLAEQDAIASAAPAPGEPPRSSLVPTALQDHCPPLVRAFTANLSHQQQKIRLSALQAPDSDLTTTMHAAPCVETHCVRAPLPTANTPAGARARPTHAQAAPARRRRSPISPRCPCAGGIPGVRRRRTRPSPRGDTDKLAPPSRRPGACAAA